MPLDLLGNFCLLATYELNSRLDWFSESKLHMGTPIRRLLRKVGLHPEDSGLAIPRG